MARIRISVVTFRRPLLLRRALESLVAQSFPDWRAEVLNDDPQDERVGDVIKRLGDARINLSSPSIRRGATGNFNFAFRCASEPYASILEDDNWWEPEFLQTMVAALEAEPRAMVACANERIWQEQADGTWRNTERTIWREQDGTSLFGCNPIDKCGSAKLCNSSLLFRTDACASWQTPSSIPVDVTEHFRERVVPHPLLLVHTPLVNYAETLTTHRSRKAEVWGAYQVLLIGSVFALAQTSTHRVSLARELWRRARAEQPQFGTSLLATSQAVPEARALWDHATIRERMRFLASSLRHPVGSARVRRALRSHPDEWRWLFQGRFAEFMRGTPHDG